MTIDFAGLKDMLPRGSRVLCAVSGGADSMCLLHLLWTNRQELGIELAAAHYEHGLRGAESLRDAGFVEQWCRQMGIRCVVGHGDVPAYAKERGLGAEEAARELRYAFLERTAAELNCGRIATAHHADDNAETILFNLTRGSGAAGLRGIPPVRGEIVRPLLPYTRAQIEAYLAENHVEHVEDSTNGSDGYSRNLIRHRVMPVLKEINPHFPAAAMRTAELMRRDEDCLSALAEDFIRENFDGESLPVDALKKLPWSVSSRAIRYLSKRSLSMEHVQAVLALTEGSGLAYAEVPGARIRRERGRLYFAQEAAAPEMAEIPVRPGESVNIPGLGLEIRAEFAVFDQEINDLFKTYCFKYESIYGNISCTGRRNGDKLRPKGRGCTKSLKSLFAEAKMTKVQRDTALVFRDGAGILAVQGLAIAERAAPSIGDRVIKIEIKRT